MVVREGALGARESIPFSLPVPRDAPFSFETAAQRVTWSVTARAEDAALPLAAVEEEVVVEPGVVAPTPEALETVTRSGLAASGLGKAGEYALGVLLLTAALPLLPLLLPSFLRTARRRARLGDIRVDVGARPRLLGEWVPVSVGFSVRNAVEVDEVTVRLEGLEHWSTGAGNSRRSHTRCFHEDAKCLLSHVWLAVPSDRRGEGRPRFEWSGAMRLPPDGLPAVSDGAVPYLLYKVEVDTALSAWGREVVSQRIPSMAARIEPPPPAPSSSEEPKTVGARDSTSHESSRRGRADNRSGGGVAPRRHRGVCRVCRRPGVVDVVANGPRPDARRPRAWDAGAAHGPRRSARGDASMTPRDDLEEALNIHPLPPEPGSSPRRARARGPSPARLVTPRGGPRDQLTSRSPKAHHSAPWSPARARASSPPGASGSAPSPPPWRPSKPPVATWSSADAPAVAPRGESPRPFAVTVRRRHTPTPRTSGQGRAG